MSSPAFISWSGFALLIVGAIWSNIAVSKMAKLMGTEWFVKNDRASFRAIRLYRAHYKDGPLYRDLKIAYWLAGVGAVIFVSGSFLK